MSQIVLLNIKSSGKKKEIHICTKIECTARKSIRLCLDEVVANLAKLEL
jgi:hypothetical protein